ncbi:serine hydrolase [Adhaeribacter sp. BT258]|uniref:Serine hydrolase n=1 Tax=Adhaeribacter terrigena TaxID=2793070 RepID=A0ABS1BZ48_9BACT|nr:serine hydrolase [Adhaeribacter terrigena]MBK0401658.1 serine hydrolase [Adhaeribacter terrigena]
MRKLYFRNGYFPLRFLGVLLAVLLFSGSLLTANAQQRITGAKAAVLQNSVDNLRTQYRVKGISAAVYSQKQGTWKGVSGISHGGVAMDTAMLLGAGSVTKTFIAAQIMKLVDANQLQLSDSLHEFIGSHQYVNPNLTIRQLLNHKSGLGDVTNVAWEDAMFRDLNKIWYIPAVIDSFLTPPVGVPGGPWSYCNANYVLLGEVIEAVTADSLHKVLRQDLLVPRTLQNTHMEVFEQYPNPTAHNWAAPNMNPLQAVDVSGYSRIALWSSAEADGGYFTDAFDLAKWAHDLYSGKVLSPGSLNEMLAFTNVNGSYFNGYGLGVMRFPTAGKTYWGHAGNYFGYAACMLYSPQDSVAIGMLINQDIISPNPARDFMATVLQTVTGLSDDVAKPTFAYYPNPASQTVNFFFPEKRPQTTLQLRDLTGKLLHETLIAETELLLNVEKYPNGIYLLNLISEAGTVTEKLVIQH